MSSWPRWFMLYCTKHGHQRWCTNETDDDKILVPCCGTKLNADSYDACMREILESELFVTEGSLYTQVTIGPINVEETSFVPSSD